MRRGLGRVVEWVGGHGLGAIVGTLGVVAASWAFLVLASLVAENRTKAFDDRILLALRTPGDLATPVGPPWFGEVARDLTALGSTDVLWLATLGVVGFLALDRKYAAATFALIAVSGGWALSFGLKQLFDRPRPDLVPHLMRAYFSSFPSGHSMMAAVVYGTLGSILASLVVLRRLKFYFLALAATVSALIGASRVYLGVHYPTDVLAGWAAGLAWATACWLVSLRLKRDRVIEPQV